MTREQALERLSQPSVTKAEEREMFKQVADFLRISESELQSYFDMPLMKGCAYKHGNNWLIKLGVKILFTLGMEKRVRK